ncbi:MAG TPA: hypothetical protein DF984_07325 [Anaerolineaceae bacterium]|nr:hypothetical protein [Anaerolineaceae bacterium]
MDGFISRDNDEVIDQINLETEPEDEEPPLDELPGEELQPPAPVQQEIPPEPSALPQNNTPASYATHVSPGGTIPVITSRANLANPSRSISQPGHTLQQNQVREDPTVRYHMLRASIQQPDPLPSSDQKPRCITITIESCGNKDQDVRRIKRLHDILISRPGRDKFAFQVCENGWRYQIDFPNVTTGLTDPLVSQLMNLIGSQNIDIAHLG